MWGLIRTWRRRRITRQPLPGAWLDIVQDRLPFVSNMGTEERTRFLEQLQIFAAEKNWEGAHDLEVTDEMKVVISGAAVRLTRNHSLDAYDRLISIVLYPSHYKHEGTDGVVFGEANSWGTIVLSWDAVEHGIANPNDGHDTAVHEFAHALDFEDGTFDGTPVLEESKDYHRWVKVFSSRYLTMKKKPHKGPLRRYGATNEAEFFAVATETFFEKPKQLRKKAPDLYEELARYFKVDPLR